MLRNLRLFLLLLLASLFISACGQKGPLYKTPPAQDNQQQTTATGKES